MVYYGALSKGCQRCRQRKIKCDQRKPSCLRCEKSKKPCPGYRDMAKIIFRDESERIIRKVHSLADERCSEVSASTVEKDMHLTFLPNSAAQTSRGLPAIYCTPCQPLSDVAAHFFFARYSCDEPPLSEDYQAWLTQLYYQEKPNRAIRAAIEAVGMSGIANTFYSPEAASKSKEQYGRAMAGLKHLLSDKVESTADTTLMTVILLGIFEFVNFENQERYLAWSAHIDGAMALLKHRGLDQFSSTRGEQLFMHVRSQILYTCLQHDAPVPSVVLELSRYARTSAGGLVWYRLLNLRAAIKSGDITDPRAIYEAAVELDASIETLWAASQLRFSYSTIDTRDAPQGTCFRGKRHIYSHPWAAQCWNSTRTMRVIINRIIFDTEVTSGARAVGSPSAALSVIRRLSTDICISSPCYKNSSRSATLIWSLFVVAREPLNHLDERCWAIDQLRHISSTLGIRQAGSLADAVIRDTIVPRPACLA